MNIPGFISDVAEHIKSAYSYKRVEVKGIKDGCLFYNVWMDDSPTSELYHIVHPDGDVEMRRLSPVEKAYLDENYEDFINMCNRMEEVMRKEKESEQE